MEAWKNAPLDGRPEPGIVGRADSAAVFKLARRPPSDATAEYVEHFWSVNWDLSDKPPHDSMVITFPSINLTHEWGTDGRRHGIVLPANLIHGVVERVFTVTLSGRGAVVGARFRPGGFAARFRRDAGGLTGQIVHADDELFSKPVVFDDDIDAATAQLDCAIASVVEPDPVYATLTTMMERIRDDEALQRADQVMELSPWSSRTTQRVFRRYVGVPVKWVLTRYRLQQAALVIETDPDVDFAGLAVRLGWYDQAHFSNEFRSMLGCSPGEYAQRYG